MSNQLVGWLGDIVYVASNNAKRLNWPLGKVWEVIPSRERKRRTVDYFEKHEFNKL